MPDDRESHESLAAREARLHEAEARLECEREALDAEKEAIKKRGWRDSVYGRINVSVATMDRVILVIGGLLAAAILAGILIK